MAFNLSSLLEGLGQAFNQQEGYNETAPQPSSVAGVDVTAAPAQRAPAPTVGALQPPPSNSAVNSAFNAYDNRAVAQALQQVRQGEPQHTGMLGVRGTLRDVLGTIGDAFLIRDGHQPIYRPQVQNERIGDAMAGFAQDPIHAAGRVASVPAPGAAELGQKINEDYQTQQLRQAQMESNNQYRQVREESLTEQKDARLRSGIGGILAAAATPDPKTGQVDPQRWAQARAQALRLGGKVSDFDESEVPDTADQYNAGYGQTARQYQQGQISGQSIQERADAANSRNVIAQQNADTNRARLSQNSPQNRPPTLSSTDASIIHKASTYGVQSLTPAELDRYNNKLVNAPRSSNAVLPPGLRPGSAGGPTAAPPHVPGQFKNGVTYTDAHGNKATYNNGQWIPVH